MPHTRTLYLDIADLADQGEVGRLILSLMVAHNDIATANQYIPRARENRPGIAKHVQRGESMYFARLMTGHLCEAMKLIGEVEQKQEMQAIINRTEHVNDFETLSVGV
jgi:hypothetical protein